MEALPSESVCGEGFVMLLPNSLVYHTAVSYTPHVAPLAAISREVV